MSQRFCFVILTVTPILILLSSGSSSRTPASPRTRYRRHGRAGSPEPCRHGPDRAPAAKPDVAGHGRGEVSPPPCSSRTRSTTSRYWFAFDLYFVAGELWTYLAALTMLLVGMAAIAPGPPTSGRSSRPHDLLRTKQSSICAARA